MIASRSCAPAAARLIARSKLSPIPWLLLLMMGCPVWAGDWPHWRGPTQNGVSPETELPERWSPAGENMLWRIEEFATRSTPVTFGGRLYTVCRAEPETTQEGERVVCLDAATGELIWESVHNVFLSDAPAERVGWSSAVVDPETGHVFYLGLGCQLEGLDGQSGQVLWEHSMSEEFGMLSTYGGRTNFPIVFENLLIISGVTTGWGETALPAHRLFAFDKLSGQLIWSYSTRVRPEDTTYCTPFVTRVNGQDALVFGAGDGSMYALQARTGQMIWRYDASNRGINTMPLVADGIVYSGHSEQNFSDTNVLGAIFALNLDSRGEIPESDLLWKVPARTVGRSQPLRIDDRLYAIDDGGTLWIVDARTGEDVARQKLGRIMFGSPVYGDGKIYVGEATGRFLVLKPTSKGVETVHQVRLNNEEILGSPIISYGRIYLPTAGALYCIGSSSSIAANGSGTQGAGRAVGGAGESTGGHSGPAPGEVSQVQLVPAEALVDTGSELPLEVRLFDAAGLPLGNGAAADGPIEYSVEGAGRVTDDGIYQAPSDPDHVTAQVTVKIGSHTATSRIRVIPPLPWKFDFDGGQVPPTWIGAAYRHQPRAWGDGESVLVKVSTIPKGTRSQSWMGPADLHDVTVQADFQATERNGKLPEMGLINQRYTLAMLPSGELQVRSWTSRLELRFARTVPFAWEPNRWYRVMFQASNEQGAAVLRGKVWLRDEAEPEEWSVEAADTTPNTHGSPGLFGNASDAEFAIDNVQVFSNR